MAGTQVQRRRGSTAEHATFTGAAGETTIDMTKKTVVVHDGATLGGFPLAREDALAVAQGDATSAGAAAATATAKLATFSHLNKLINPDFRVNQRGYVSGAAVGAGLYGHDRWKMAASGDTYTFSTTANKTTVTIPAGKVLRQVVEGVNLQSGTYVLSWEGTAQGKIGAGALSASGVTGAITGGVDTTIEFGPGTVANVQLEIGTFATPFEKRPIGLEELLCMRYAEAGIACRGTNYGASSQRVNVPIYFKARKRTSPATLSIGTGAVDYSTVDGMGVYALSVAAGAEYAPGSYFVSAEL